MLSGAAMELQRIPVPLWSPSQIGPWRLRETKTDGTVHLSTNSYQSLALAEQDAGWCNARGDGAVYDVIPDPGGALWTV